LNVFRFTYPILLALVHRAGAGPNAGVSIDFATLSPPCGLQAGDRVEFLISAREMEAVRQIKFDFSWDRPGAITGAIGSTAAATKAEAFIAPGAPQIENDTATYGMAAFGGDGLQGEGQLAFLGFELSNSITPDTPIAVYIDAISLGPSFTERDTIYPAEAVVLANYCDESGTALKRALYLDAPESSRAYSTPESTPVVDDSRGEITLAARLLTDNAFSAGQNFTWQIDNPGPGTLYVLNGDIALAIAPGTRDEIAVLSDRRGDAALHLDAHSDANGSPTTATIEVCAKSSADLPCASTQVTWHQPTTAIAEVDNSVTPATSQLYANYPNPFNASTIIPFSIATGSSTVQLDIFNLSGQKIVTLVRDHRPSGQYQVHWDGRDRRGHPAASGVYLYRLQLSSSQQLRRMLLLR